MSGGPAGVLQHVHATEHRNNCIGGQQHYQYNAMTLSLRMTVKQKQPSIEGCSLDERIERFSLFLDVTLPTNRELSLAYRAGLRHTRSFPKSKRMSH